jgi:hypothetical protein
VDDRLSWTLSAFALFGFVVVLFPEVPEAIMRLAR